MANYQTLRFGMTQRLKDYPVLSERLESPRGWRMEFGVPNRSSNFEIRLSREVGANMAPGRIFEETRSAAECLQKQIDMIL